MKLKLKLACLICVFAIPVILSSCKESIDVKEVTPNNLSQGVKPSDKEIEDFKNWYSNVESSPNARVGAKDEIYEIQEVELWKKAKSHKQEKSSNKLIILPLIDFKEKGKTKVKQLYLTEIDGKKSGYKVEINSSNDKSGKFTGTVIITSLDEKSKREYKYKDNKLESKKNSRIADYGNANLPEVIVSASVLHNGTWFFIQLQFNANMNRYVMYASVEANDPLGGSSYSIDPDYDPALIEAMLDWLKDKLLAEATYRLKPGKMAILRAMSTGDIVRFANNYLTAQAATNRYFYGQADVDYGHANAFKHALFATLHKETFGSNIALQLTNAHEVGETGCATAMDFANNGIGLNLSVTSYSNFDALANDIYRMAKTGQLWTLGGGCIHQVPF